MVRREDGHDIRNLVDSVEGIEDRTEDRVRAVVRVVSLAKEGIEVLEDEDVLAVLAVVFVPFFKELLGVVELLELDVVLLGFSLEPPQGQGLAVSGLALENDPPLELDVLLFAEFAELFIEEEIDGLFLEVRKVKADNREVDDDILGLFFSLVQGLEDSLGLVCLRDDEVIGSVAGERGDDLDEGIVVDLADVAVGEDVILPDREILKEDNLAFLVVPERVGGHRLLHRFDGVHIGFRVRKERYANVIAYVLGDHRLVGLQDIAQFVIHVDSLVFYVLR